MILTSVFNETFANAFPEKTFFLTTKPFEVSGNATAPDTNAALNLADNLGAIALPSTLLENTITLAPVFVATSAIAFV